MAKTLTSGDRHPSIPSVRSGLDYVAVDVATVEDGHYPLYDCWHEAFNRPEFRDRIAGSFAEFLDRALASGGRCYWLADR